MRGAVVTNEKLQALGSRRFYRPPGRAGRHARRRVAGTVIARYGAGTGNAVRLLVVSVSLRFWNSTVIGGLHAGWNVAVAVRV
jgi:hypothetical protein